MAAIYSKGKRSVGVLQHFCSNVGGSVGVLSEGWLGVSGWSCCKVSFEVWLGVPGWTVTTTACCKAMRFWNSRNTSSNHQPKVSAHSICCGYTHFLRFGCAGLIAELEPRILTSRATCEQQQAAMDRITSLLHEPLKVCLV